ncbi:hypothetical protein ACHAQA_007412 [Verticillium albo-atrum]
MNKNWNDRADKDLFFTILSVKNIGIISGSEWTTIGNHMRSLGYGFTNEGCRQHFQGLRRAQHKADTNGLPPDSSRKNDPTTNPITRRPGPGRGRPRKNPLNPADGTGQLGDLTPPQPMYLPVLAMGNGPFPEPSDSPAAPPFGPSTSPHAGHSAVYVPGLPGPAVKTDEPASHPSISPGAPNESQAPVGRAPEEVAGPVAHPQETSFAETRMFQEPSGYTSSDPPHGHGLVSATAAEPSAPLPHPLALSEQTDAAPLPTEDADHEVDPPESAGVTSNAAHLPDGRDDDDHEPSAKRRRVEEPTETQQALDDEAVLALAAAHNATPPADHYASEYPHPDADHPDGLDDHSTHDFSYNET